MNKMLWDTSNTAMRLLLKLAVAVLLLSLPTVSSAFDCPLMTATAAHAEPCSDCPAEEEESCPLSDCLLICPYTVEKTAVWTGEKLTSSFIPQAERSSALIIRLFPDAHLFSMSAPRDFHSGPFYLINRALLI